MTRWQIVKLLVQVLFSRNFACLVDKLFGRKETDNRPTPCTDSPKSRMATYEYDPVSSRLTRRP